MNRYDNLYRGIIVQNNDPSNSGRVKVFVPGINLTQLPNWNQKKVEDKAFKVMGKNTNTSLSLDILQNQKERLFWAEVMLPIVGMSAPGYYHAPQDIYYTGNDSDYTFQGDNKNDAFFEQDAQEAQNRETQPQQHNPSYGTPPRTRTILNFPQSGSKFVTSLGCDELDGSASTPSIWKNSSPLISSIVHNLPQEYIYKEIDLDASPINSSVVNVGVLGVSINTTNPTIFLNGKQVEKDNPVYNSCDPTVQDFSDKETYSAPIFFEEDLSAKSPTSTYETIPVKIFVNGKSTIPDEFELEGYTNTEVFYKSGNIRVVTPIKNITGVTVTHNNSPFDFSKISSIKPIIFPESPVIMPRAPITNGASFISRGGGGGEIFNSVISKLLPTMMRKDSHLGGANNESKQTVNHGRKSLNDPNCVKGNNLIGDYGQVHRGPQRSTNYNNDWKGLMGIPGVGSHVWVRFENGDPNFPIIMGTYANQANYKGIYKIA